MNLVGVTGALNGQKYPVDARELADCTAGSGGVVSDAARCASRRSRKKTGFSR